MSQDSKVDALLEKLVDARQSQDYQTALSVSNQIIELKPEFCRRLESTCNDSIFIRQL